MPFCTSCGSEVEPGSKFCEECGAPVEQKPGMPAPAASPAPVTVPPSSPPKRPPLVPPPPPQKPVPVAVIAVVAVVVLLVLGAAVWFVGLPYLAKSRDAGPAAPTPVPAALTLPPTPGTYGQPPETTYVPTPTATVRKLEGRYEEYYDEIYALGQDFSYGATETVTRDITVPPLFIKYNLTPRMLTREKVINIGMSTEQMIQITNPSPNAWFEIKVFDVTTGAVVAKHGYGKDYPDVTKSEFMVRSPGTYRIEFSGHDVYADVSVLQGTT